MSHNLLFIGNAIIWLAPIFIFRGISAITIALINILFCSSYWTYILICDALDINYGPAVLSEHVESSLVYSLFAGLAINAAFLIFAPRKINFSGRILLTINDLVEKIPGRRFSSIAKIIFIFLMIYCYVQAYNMIGIGDRNYFASLDVFWMNVILPFLGLLSAAIIIWEYQKSRLNSILPLLFIIYPFIFLVGFDGGRRASGITIIAFLLVTAILFIQNRKKVFTAAINLAIMILMAGFLSYGRNFLVGWEIIPKVLSFGVDITSVTDYLMLTLFAPMPTVHVNTHMIDYIASNGTQGYWNYLSAALNTLFPKFIFQEYFFGEPLVTRIGREMNWFGFDFGFMAEAIYSGGLTAVVSTHFIMGVFISFLLRNVKRGSYFSSILIGVLFFALVNSLRSDFMNLLKMLCYPAVFLYLLLALKRLRLK